MKYFNFLFIMSIFMAFTCSNSNKNEMILLENNDDIIKIYVKKECRKNIQKKIFKFKFSDGLEKSETLIRYNKQKDVYYEVDQDRTFLLQNGVAVKAIVFLRYYFDEKFLHESWYTYEQWNTESHNFDPLILKKATLTNIYYSAADTLYQFQIEDESDLILEYTYDQNLNLKKYKVNYYGPFAYEREYLLKQ